MRSALLLLLLSGGCAGQDRGLALDVIIDSQCAFVGYYAVQITTTPATALHGGGAFTKVTPPAKEFVALLPEGTTHAKVSVFAFSPGDKPIGIAVELFDLPKHGLISRTVSVAFSSCNPPDDAGAPMNLTTPRPDLKPPDLAGADLRNAHFLTGISVQGSYGNSVFEGEGATAPAGSGVALVAFGIGLEAFTSIAASNGVTVDGIVHSTDGTRLGASLHLPVDPAHDAAAGLQSVQLTFSGTATANASFSVVPLDELTSAATPLLTDGSPKMFSTVNLPPGSTLMLPGPRGPAFLVATASFSADTIIAGTSAGGFPGCSVSCASGNGPGAPASGNGGGGYGAASTGGGLAYGDPSVIGLPGGSGGGGGNAGGGAGGASVRILGGSVSITGNVTVNGDNGASAGALALGSAGGGGGSGGTLLIQSRGALVVARAQAHADGGGGGAGAVAGSPGGNGAPGRIRFDVGVPGAMGGTVSPPVGYLGATISADFPTAQKLASLAAVELVCGSSTRIEIWIDGAKAGSGTCGATLGRTSFPLIRPFVADGELHLFCARSLAQAGSPTEAYSSPPFQEDFSCRSLVLLP